VLVVDDGSQDETAQVAAAVADRDPRVTVISYSPNRGKGHAVKTGMLAAQGAYRVFLDVDLATPVEETDKLLEALAGGAQVALGSRHLPQSRVEVRQAPLRRWMGNAFRRLARWMLRVPASDITCGFKGFREDAARRLFAALIEPGWAFDAELIYLAFKWGLTVQEVPVRWRDSADSTVRPLQAARQSFAALLRIRRDDRRGLYDRPPTYGA
jgi:dolichyl-phosphate beta-glucosyltransferase